MAQIQEIFDQILRKGCYNELLVDFKFGGECTKLAISKVLSYAIIAGALLLKVPQILKMTGSKSAAGLSITSLVIELLGFLLTAAFYFRDNKPFSTYGETLFIIVQNIIIIFLCFSYGKRNILGFLFIVAGYAALAYVLTFTPIVPLFGNEKSAQILSQFSPEKLQKDPTVLTRLFQDQQHALEVFRAVLNLEYLQSLNIILLIVSRMQQIIPVFREKSAGQLAIITWILNFLGAAARLFTTVVETPEKIFSLASYGLSVFLSATIIFQILYYGNPEQKKNNKQQNQNQNQNNKQQNQNKSNPSTPTKQQQNNKKKQ